MENEHEREIIDTAHAPIFFNQADRQSVYIKEVITMNSTESTIGRLSMISGIAPEELMQRLLAAHKSSVNSVESLAEAALNYYSMTGLLPEELEREPTDHRERIAKSIAGRLRLFINKPEETYPETFTISPDELLQVFRAVRHAYDERGYHTLQYWRNSPEGLAVAGEYLMDILSGQNPALFAKLFFSVADQETQGDQS